MGIMNTIFGNVSEMDIASLQKSLAHCFVRENVLKGLIS